MDRQRHWDHVYQTKAPDALSWFRPHLERSLELIRCAAPDPAAAIIDVGGGESTLVDDLLAAGYRDITVLDISQAAVDVARRRIGPAGDAVQWRVADITQIDLGADRYDVWHDRAVFHFLTEPAQRAAYVRAAMRAVRPLGHVIVATFGPVGPTQCSGLDVVRYDARALHAEFGASFELVDSATEVHRTPWGTAQQFLYCHCVKVAPQAGAGAAGR